MTQSLEVSLHLTKCLYKFSYLSVPSSRVKLILDKLIEADISYKITTVVPCPCGDDYCILSVRFV